MLTGLDHAGLADQVKAGDVRSVSRLITLLEADDPAGRAVLTRLTPPPRPATLVGITGYPGAGKSTLIDRMITAYRRQGRKVGIVAVDSSSPVTGGALLGDRIRMQDQAGDPGVFIRSMATRGQQGGLARATHDAVFVLEAAGYDPILVETVGVGQAEVDVLNLAGIVVAVVAPGLGDEVQAMKAGLLEVAHIIVVNKADRDNADSTIRDLQQWHERVIRTVAVKGDGVDELLAAIAGSPPSAASSRRSDHL